MLRLSVRGAVVGAALLGALIAILGGASMALLAVTWALGTLMVVVGDAVRRRRRQRAASWTAGGSGGEWRDSTMAALREKIWLAVDAGDPAKQVGTSNVEQP